MYQDNVCYYCTKSSGLTENILSSVVAIGGDLLYGAEDPGVRGDSAAPPGRVLGVCKEDQAAGSTVRRRAVDGARIQQQ